MCSDHAKNLLLHFKEANSPQQLPPPILHPAHLDSLRLTQLYNYALAAERLRSPVPLPGNLFPPFPPLRPEFWPYCRLDPRLSPGLCRPPEEPKPQHSYIGLIAMAILSSPDKKLVLSDIYQYILDNYPYFRSRGPGWRNSIRHNLSLNDCFVKAGRSANGKGHYWAIHPANIDDFTKGDFRRRKAQRKVRRHMGLAVDDEDSPSPPPNSPPPVWGSLPGIPPALRPPQVVVPSSLFPFNPPMPVSQGRKRNFDVASLLAPDNSKRDRTEATNGSTTILPHHEETDEDEGEEGDDEEEGDQKGRPINNKSSSSEEEITPNQLLFTGGGTSLASLMLFSSRYREVAAAARRSAPPSPPI